MKQPLPIFEESHDSSRGSQDLTSRPTSFYSQISRPSSEVLPNAQAIPHIPFPPHFPRVDACYRPLSLDSIPSSLPSLPKSRPTSFNPPRFNPLIYDHLVESKMSVSISDMSRVEPRSFYQAEMNESFS